MKTTFLALAIFCSTVLAAQQVPPLERLITLQLNNSRLIDVMDEIEKQATLSFSYNSSLIDEDRILSVKASQRPVREVLKKIFGNGIVFRAKKNYIILSAASATDSKVVVGGYVHSTDGKPVKDATVYDSNTLASANTDQYGYYEIKLERNSESILKVNKSEYRDTLSPLKPHGGELQNMVLEPQKADTTWRGRLKALSDSTVVFFGRIAEDLRSDSLFISNKDSVEKAHADSLRAVRFNNLSDSTRARWNNFRQWFLADSIRMRNVNDTIYRRAQVSLLPFVGTNRKMSPYCINDYSFNILAGYNRGSRKMEFGGLANISRGDVEGAQLSGFMNLTGGNLHCFQAAGFNNINLGNTSGAQFAGFTNINLGNTNAFQASGFTNINGGDTQGASFAGFGNIVAGNASGLMMAGFMNIAAHDMHGAQVAGFMNVTAGDLYGTQLSGFINCARNVHGSQFGFINVAQSVSGIPVGFISIVRNGYHSLELSANDMFYANASFRTGVRSFYNIFSAGVRPGNEPVDEIWTYGYGLGTSPRITDKLFLNIDVTGNHVVMDAFTSAGNDPGFTQRVRAFDYINLDGQLYIGAEVRLGRSFGLTGGLLAHCWVTETDLSHPGFFNGSEPHYAYESTSDDIVTRIWAGWKVGLRIF